MFLSTMTLLRVSVRAYFYYSGLQQTVCCIHAHSTDGGTPGTVQRFNSNVTPNSTTDRTTVCILLCVYHIMEGSSQQDKLSSDRSLYSFKSIETSFGPLFTVEGIANIGAREHWTVKPLPKRIAKGKVFKHANNCQRKLFANSERNSCVKRGQINRNVCISKVRE